MSKYKDNEENYNFVRKSTNRKSPQKFSDLNPLINIEDSILSNNKLKPLSKLNQSLIPNNKLSDISKRSIIPKFLLKRRSKSSSLLLKSSHIQPNFKLFIKNSKNLVKPSLIPNKRKIIKFPLIILKQTPNQDYFHYYYHHEKININESPNLFNTDLFEDVLSNRNSRMKKMAHKLFTAKSIIENNKIPSRNHNLSFADTSIHSQVNKGKSHQNLDKVIQRIRHILERKETQNIKQIRRNRQIGYGKWYLDTKDFSRNLWIYKTEQPN